jgi:hypothetical protein
VPIGRTVNVPVSGHPRAMLVQAAWIRAIGAQGEIAVDPHGSSKGKP